jgi:signal peptidase I
MTGRGLRETVESVVVAFILAFLFRTFQAEAFVIPTGSMAPTLMGAHKDVTCPECGYQYAAGASSEDSQMAEQQGREPDVRLVLEACCPLCRYWANVGPGSGERTFGGDRILVSKFAYDFREPERWSVIVFKNPSEAQTNFIKRCVGLPGETIRIRQGDIFVRASGDDSFRRALRGPREQRAMAQIVYDNDYVVDEMTKAGWPLRWQQFPADDAGWKSEDGGRSFAIDRGANETGSAEKWLRYQHFVPSIPDWRQLVRGDKPSSQVKPLLVTDFVAYNTSVPQGATANDPRMLGLHWVGDLMLECDLESTDGKGAAVLDLVKGGHHFRAALDFESGEVALTIDDQQQPLAKANAKIQGSGSHEVIFANIDRQLRLWIDGDVLEFAGETAATYPQLEDDIPRSTPQDPLDLAPAGIASRGAGLAARHIKLWRDLYYVAMDRSPPMFSPLADYNHPSTPGGMSYTELYEFWSNPARWSPEGGRSPFTLRRTVEFPLAVDQFFMLGDNSPASSDARLWDEEKFVARELLVGQALLIFWPHSFHQIPGTSIPFPFFPNFARMGFIR